LSVLWDLVLRGVRAALVEKDDLAAGTSARFHGLLHSGGRYAVNDIDAARECISENRILKRVAWHCVEDCGGYFLQMDGDDDGYVDRWVRACREAGITVGEADPGEVLRQEPCLSPSLKRAFSVPDAAIDGFRLVYTCARLARDRGAAVFPYTRVTRILTMGGRVEGVEAEGPAGVLRLACGIVVNAAGAFAGRVAHLAGVELAMAPNRGTMIVFNHKMAGRVLNRLAPPGDADIFVPHNTTMILGTTSVDIDEPDDYRPSPGEVERLLTRGGEMVADLGRYRMLRAYAGVRPLYAAGAAKGRGATRNFLLIDHAREDGLEGLVTITGGKFTTCRLMAEKTGDLVGAKLGRRSPCLTAERPMVEPGKKESERVRRVFAPGWGDLVARRAAWNLDAVLAQLAGDKLAGDNLCECEGVSLAEARAACREGAPRGLGEVRRRTRLGTGTCQGLFCGFRAAGLLVEDGLLPPEKFQPIVAEFLEKRWRGQRAVLRERELAAAQLATGICTTLLGLERYVP